jgi:hypothetical protein
LNLSRYPNAIDLFQHTYFKLSDRKIFFLKNIEIFINLLTIYIESNNSMDESTKKKISSTLRGRKKTARTKWLISIAMKNKKKTEEHKEAISLSMLEFWKDKNE